MIPSNISKESVVKAIRQIDEDGIPSRRLSTKYYLVYGSGKHKLYPPKYILSIANKIENGHELNPSNFSGEAETNTIFDKLGFEVKQASDFSDKDNVNIIPKTIEEKSIIDIGTVLIHSPKRNAPPNEFRTQLLEKIVLSCTDLDVVLLPAGFYEYENANTEQQAKEVEKILNLIHSFYPKGTSNSGDVPFVRKGFPGASKNWNCPVFGAVVFFEREIHWPEIVDSRAFFEQRETALPIMVVRYP